MSLKDRLKEIFLYVKPLWEGPDGKISLKRVLAIMAAVDLVINVHKSAGIALEIVTLYVKNKAVDPATVSTIMAGIPSIALLVGIESALVAALLGLSAMADIQNKKLDLNSAAPDTTN